MKVLLILNIILTIILTSCGNNNDIPINNIKNIDLNQNNLSKNNLPNIKKYSTLSFNEKIKVNCNDYSDSFENAFCKENQPELIKEQFYINTINTKNPSDKIKECSLLYKENSKENSNKLILSEATKCRIRIILTGKINVDNKKPNNLDCNLLSQYKEEEICNNIKTNIKKYIEYKNSEKIYNDIFGR